MREREIFERGKIIIFDFAGDTKYTEREGDRDL